MQKDNQGSSLLTQGAIGWTLFKMTKPMVWGMLAVISLNLVDTYFIAKLGKKELAAMSFSLPIVLIVMNLSLGLSVGTGSVLARAIGRGDKRSVKILATSGIFLGFLMMMGCSLLGISTLYPLFQIFNAPDSVVPLINQYMYVWYWGLPMLGIAMIANTGMTSSGEMRLPAAIMGVVAFLNLLLDPLMIFGLFGFPRLEMQGAALATVLSYVVACFLSFFLLMFKTKMLTIRLKLKEMLIAWKEIIELSIPAASSQMIVPFTSAITVWMLSHFGPSVVGGYGIVSRLEAFSLIIIVGLSNCLAPFVGQNWGAGHFERVRLSVLIGYKFALIWGAVLATFFAIGYRFIPQIFIDDPAVVSTVSLYLVTVPISYAGTGSLFVTNAVLNAIGESKTVAVITVFRYFVFYLPFSLFAMKYFGPKGIFSVISIVNVIMGIGAFFWVKRELAKLAYPDKERRGYVTSP